MELNDRQRRMIKVASDYWSSLDIRTPKELGDWKKRHFITPEKLEKLEQAQQNGTLVGQHRERFSCYKNSVCTEEVTNIIGVVVPKAFRDLMQQISSGGFGAAELDAMTNRFKVVYQLQQSLEVALNPTHAEEFKHNAHELAHAAIETLIGAGIAFKPEQYLDYPRYALQQIAPYLPLEFCKILIQEPLLQFGANQPDTKVNGGRVDSTVVGILDKIREQSKHRPGG